ncbi:MAG TPA: flagellar hook-associated protein FlgK [Nitrospiraceae bacterium]|nr:flagellar hook-associated protein FlgK [Nitrospiraceae bacterium]
MSGISNLFNIGSSGLFAFQQALAVTAHNMANVSTKGYSKQNAILAEAPPINGRPGQIGTGVQVIAIQRNVDGFIDGQLLSSREQLGQNDASNSALSDIEGLFGDSTDQSLGTDLNNLFRAFQDVATDPSNVTSRSVLLSNAQTIVDRFHQADSTLTTQRQSLDQEIGQTITTVNNLSQLVADLNDKISQAELSGQQANDLRDQRQRLVNNLGEQVGVTTLEDAHGQVSIFTGNGQTLVNGNRAYAVTGVPNAGNSGLLDIQYQGSGTPVNITSVVSGGRLKGLLDARDHTIPDVLTKLDTLASNLVTEVNTQHQLGVGLDGSTGLSFFNPAGMTARSIGVALTDGQQVAASDSAGGLPGNNVNALALANLQQKSIGALNNATLNTYYQTIASGVGSNARQASQALDAQQTVQDQLEAHWSEVSGVSLDEELVNMMTYQRAFQASSRVVVMADELMQTILSLKQ